MPNPPSRPLRRRLLDRLKFPGAHRGLIASRFRSNLLSNLAAAAWTAALQIACVPIFIRLMGVEAYGLVGFYVALQVSLQVFGSGLGLTVNRELARREDALPLADGTRDLVRTAEWLVWLVGAALALVIFAAAGAIATRWLRTSSLPSWEMREILQLMAVALLFQWPLNFYQNGLNGLHRQMQSSMLRILFSGLANGGAVVVLLAVSPDARAFFAWQAIVGAVQIAALSGFFWRCLPARTGAARFDLSRLRGVSSFAGDAAAITILGTVLTQMDKLVLSRLVTMEEFGCYTVAGVVASSLQVIITPIFSTVFPRLSSFVGQNDAAAERALYHQATQLMALLVLPVTCVLTVFSEPVLQLWTGNADLARRAAPIAGALLIGSALNGLMHIPYALQLSHGWTRFALRFAAVKVIVFLPMLLWAVTRYGGLGAAVTWLVLNATYLTIGVPVTHRYLLRGDALRWLFRDVGLPLVAVLATVALCRVLAGSVSGWTALLMAMATGLASLLVAAMAVPELRQAIRTSLVARGRP